MKPDEDDRRTPLKPKKSLWERFNERLYNFFEPKLKQLNQQSVIEQERYVERFSITICVGFACVLSSFFYWFLPPLVRVLVVPVFIGAAWWAGARIAPSLMTPEGREQLIQSFNIVETRQLLEAIMFTACSCLVAVVPLVFVPYLLAEIMNDPAARTLLLSGFAWILIGAPLFVLSKVLQVRLAIVVLFSIPSAVLVWSLVLKFLYSL